MNHEIYLEAPMGAEQFDAIMQAAPAFSAIHLGVGVFETHGFMHSIPGGWNPKSGQRIVGAGMGLTTIKLVGATTPYTGDEYHCIKFPFDEKLSPDGFECSDFTVDCNSTGQLNPQVSCGAIALPAGGRHVRIRRVRVINFGSHGPEDNYRENLVICISGNNVQKTNVVNCVIEDCVAEQPSPNVKWNSTILAVAGSVDSTRTYYSRGCVLRNNYVSCQADDNTLPHAMMSADCGTGSVVEGNRLLHGATGGPWHDTASTIDLTVRDNFYYDVWTGPAQNLGYQYADGSPGTVGNWIVENNIITQSGSVPFPITAILSNIADQVRFEAIPYAFRNVLVRGNIIRQMDGPGDRSGITLRSTCNLRVEENIIDVAHPITFRKSAAPSFFNNLSPSGKPQRGYDEASQSFQSELTTEINDALLLSL